MDDNPDSGSVAALEAAGESSRLIIASTDQRPDDLARVKKLLEGMTIQDCPLNGADLNGGPTGDQT